MKLTLVSICCAAYNYEKYIVDTIEGILNQINYLSKLNKQHKIYPYLLRDLDINRPN